MKSDTIHGKFTIHSFQHSVNKRVECYSELGFHWTHWDKLFYLILITTPRASHDSPSINNSTRTQKVWEVSRICLGNSNRAGGTQIFLDLRPWLLCLRTSMPNTLTSEYFEYLRVMDSDKSKILESSVLADQLCLFLTQTGGSLSPHDWSSFRH